MVYVLHRKSNCKKIKIRVVEGVVQVSAPFTVSKREIDRFVHEQEAWIENQLDKCALSKENDLISLLGNEYKLHYMNKRICYVEGNDLYLYPDKTLIQRFLKQNVKKYIDLRFKFFCEQLNIHDISLQYGFYMFLYILFFLMDDIVVFAIAMKTLDIKGISSKYGKYSHLIGGIFMLLIGLLMILKPEWLMFNFK